MKIKILLGTVILLGALFLINTAMAASRTINFSGYNWTVKSGWMGPGPNWWNNDTESAWVDNSGALHLRIKKIDNRWHSAEVYLPKSLGYGTYEFTLDGRVDLLDPNVVAGLFLYQDDSHELDIELSRWQVAGDPNLHFSVQPVRDARTTNTKSQQLVLPGSTSVYKIDWTPNKIKFSAFANGVSDVVWEYVGKNNFVPGKEKADINFWLVDGENPANGQEAELVVKQFKFTAYTAPVTTVTSTVSASEVSACNNSLDNILSQTLRNLSGGNCAVLQSQVYVELLQDRANLNRTIEVNAAETKRLKNEIKKRDATIAQLKKKLAPAKKVAPAKKTTVKPAVKTATKKK